MSKDHLLLGLVVTDVVLVALTIAAEFALNWTLPEPLRGYEFGNLGIAGAMTLFPLWAAIVIATFVSWIGLINFWRPSRVIYAGAWVAWVLLLIASGPSVMTAAGAAIETLEHLVGGAILGLVYFSDLSKRFEEEEEPTSARVPGSPAVP
jgi:hypothetical protein